MRPSLISCSPTCSPGKMTGETGGKEDAELWPKFDGDPLEFAAFTGLLSGFVTPLKGKVTEGDIICSIGEYSLSKRLVDILSEEWSDGTLSLPDTHEDMLFQVYEICRRPELAKPHLIRRIESWADIKPVEEYTELEVIDQVLELHMLVKYHEVTDAFLSYDVLQELAEYISDDTLMEMHKVIGDEVTDEQLPERVIKYFKVRKKMLSSSPEGGSLETSSSQVSKVQKARDPEVTGKTIPHKLVDCPLFAEDVCRRERLVEKSEICSKGCLHAIAGELNPLLQVRQPDPSCPRGVTLESQSPKVSRAEEARDLEATGRAVSLQIQVDRGAKRAPKSMTDEEPATKKVSMCFMSCAGEHPHKLVNCPSFNEEPVSKRFRLVKKFNVCFSCLESGHEARKCLHVTAGELNPLLQVRQPAGELNPQLQVKQTAGESNPQLQVSQPDPVSQPTKVSADTAPSAMMASCTTVLVPTQEVKIPGKGGTCIIMYDTGSQITLISKSCAELIGAKEVGTSSLVVVGIGGGEKIPYKMVEVTLAGKDGKDLTFRAHSVSELSIETIPYDLNLIQKVFPQVSANRISCPVGTISILLGADNAQLMPREVDRQGKMILYNSLFAGDSELVVLGQADPCSPSVYSLTARVSNVIPISLNSEAMQTNLPCRCRSCDEDQFRTDGPELKVMADNLKFNEKCKLEPRLINQNKLSAYDVAGRNTDVDASAPVTSPHLEMEHATVDPPRLFAEGAVPTPRRLQYVQESKRSPGYKSRGIRSYNSHNLKLLKCACLSLVDNKVRRILFRCKNSKAVYRVSGRSANEKEPDSAEPEPPEPPDPEPPEPPDPEPVKQPKPIEPEPTEPLEQEPDRPAAVAEPEPVELHETSDTRHQHQEAGVTPVPAQGVGVGRRQSVKLAEPPPTCDPARATSHSEGAPTPPSRQAPSSWAGRLRAGQADTDPLVG